jgi:hypothetical protein
MKKLYALLAVLVVSLSIAFGQFTFNPEIDTTFRPTTVKFPASPLKYQVLFIGGHDSVETTPTYNNPAKRTLAKQWHDFIGFTPAPAGSPDYGWVSVNHEMIQANDFIGDGGGMTVFKIRRDAATDTLSVVPQTLADGRSGKFFNVDFVNTVGETGMNCGGIVGPDGRIWTAEEWLQGSNSAIRANGNGFRDTADFTIGVTTPAGFPGFNNQTIKRYQNVNWMVEIDPKEAKAIRKQYNWGRQEYEGGVITSDNKTVYFGSDATPGFFSKFVADVAGDFTKGKTYVYKHDSPTKWLEIDNTDLNKMLNYAQQALALGATMYNRIEWIALDPITGDVYFTETGRDAPGSAFNTGKNAGGVIAPHHTARANTQGTTPFVSSYYDYYGRVMKYNAQTSGISVYLEGGPYLAGAQPESYPATHLSNPDGLNFLHINAGTSSEKLYMIIQEDLNGTSFARVPNGNPVYCEVYLLDMSIINPTLNDLVRIAITPVGAEVTGAIATPDGKTLLINSQHPSTSNPFPYNNSLTFAITGWDEISTSIDRAFNQPQGTFKVFPNPVSRLMHFESATDVALYDHTGKRIKVARNVEFLDASDLAAGVYYIQNAEGVTTKIIVE